MHNAIQSLRNLERFAEEPAFKQLVKEVSQCFNLSPKGEAAEEESSSESEVEADCEFKGGKTVRVLRRKGKRLRLFLEALEKGRPDKDALTYLELPAHRACVLPRTINSFLSGAPSLVGGVQGVKE